jgi:hypothetical protein
VQKLNTGGAAPGKGQSSATAAEKA